MKIPLASLPVGQQRCVRFDSTVVLVCRTESGIFAIENYCTHSDFPLFGAPVVNDIIICPAHGASFDLKTGAPITNKRLDPVKTYSVTIEGDVAVLGLPEQS